MALLFLVTALAQHDHQMQLIPYQGPYLDARSMIDACGITALCLVSPHARLTPCP